VIEGTAERSDRSAPDEAERATRVRPRVREADSY
jgi:hypothetical protein